MDGIASRPQPGPRYAIVGIGCRFPGGADSADAFWTRLAGGFDAIGEIPADRPEWRALYDPDPAAAGRIYAKLGGFIDDIDRFDAQFFGISPREALHIDPQHRLLLEVTWQAFEDAHIPLDRLAGSDTGVFVGISTHDYADVQMYPENREQIGPHSNSGGATSIAANRVSFTYDLRGPSLAVDTACSSSLTAVHLACRALDAGDCSMAIAAGVQLLLRPELTVGFCRATMLSVDGHCKAFDEAGNGYVRSEGAGVVLIKPLDRALADGDRIYAVILGSAVNQDGRTSSLTIPSGEAQQAMLRSSLARAGVDPASVQYVEAHGPGTAVGDPIEATAIGTVFGLGRDADDPLLVGSVKTNIGHLEAASGIAGLIKTALAIRHRQIPPSLHFNRWNPAIDAAALKLRMTTARQDWPVGAAGPLAAINSFGFGGANASVVLGAPPLTEPPAAAMTERAEILPVSAQSAEALNMLAAGYSALLTGDRFAPAEIAGAAALGRSHNAYRLAVVGESRDAMADAIDCAIGGDKSPNVATGRVNPELTGKLAFVFAGMGPQWWAMGRQLLDEEPAFAAMMERCDAALRPHSGWSLIDEFRADEDRSRIAHPMLAQVSNFALQMALTALWAEWGITPGAVVGHSGGAMAAACVAGVHSLDDAIWLAFHRSRLQGQDANAGEMLATGLSAMEADALIRGHEAQVSLAAVNGPSTTTLAGDGEVLRALAAKLTAEQKFARMLAVTIAYHSPKMDPIRDEFLAAVRGLAARPATLPFVSDTTGDWEAGQDCNADYWWRAIRQPVRFAESISTLAEAGYAGFVEISPHPVLITAINECLQARGVCGLVVPSLRRKEDERAAMLRSLGQLYVNGATPNWEQLYSRDPSVPLPSYPFQRERHWFEPEAGQADAVGESDANPLLGRRMAGAQPLWETRLESPALAYLADHIVEKSVVVPGAAYVAAGLTAAVRINGRDGIALRDLSFERPLILGDGPTRMQLAIDGDGQRFRIYGRAGDAADWSRHAQGRIARPTTAAPLPLDLAVVSERMAALDIDAFYDSLAQRGLVYGPRFRGVTGLRVADGEALATIGPLAGILADPDAIHPALLDAAFQVLVAVAAGEAPDDNRLFLPTAIEEVRLYRRPGAQFHVHCRLDAMRANSAIGSFTIVDGDGTVLAEIHGLQARLVEAPASQGSNSDQWFYSYDWEPKPIVITNDAPRRPALVRRGPNFAARMAEAAVEIETDTRWSRYYDEAEPILSEAAAAHGLAAFAELGARIEPGALIDAAWLDRLRETEPSGGRWLNRLLTLLDATGCVEREVGGYRILRQPTANGRDDRLPGYDVDLALLARAGATLAPALAGDSNGRDAIFSQDSLPLLTRFYRDAPASDHYNRVLSRAVGEIVANASPAGCLRVLEVGAGTGGATVSLLPLLPADRTRYLFTDTAPLLLDAARTAFADVPWLETRQFDVTRDAAAQGFLPQSFDLIIAANVVHATPDVAATLDRLKDLLAPGGALAMIEITRHPPWLDVIFGQTRGWWAFDDRALRTEHPLLEAAQWRECLEQVGFVDVWTSSEQADGENAQSVILAMRPPAETAPSWVILGDPEGSAATLATTLNSLGVEASLAHDIDATMATPAGVIDMRSIGAGADYEHAQAQGVGAVLPLIQDLLRRECECPIWLVTAGGAMLPGDHGDPLSAPIWGFGRTIMKEHAELDLRMADIGAEPDRAAIEALAREITELDREEEVAFRGATRHVRRLRRVRPDETPAKPAKDLAWRAEIGVSGSLASLRLRDFRPAPLAANEVRIAVKAASLNFRDVMLAMGGIPGLEEELSFGQQRLGSDCAGIVEAVGPAVTRFRAGDEVMGMAPGALASSTVTADHFLIAKPPSLAFEEAATLPTVFLTAWYALTKLARLGKGERVLIHAASGGVGLAAIQIAQAIGAEIFATAGSDAKRDHLRTIGVRHVMDSRSTAFAEEVMEATAGIGVDVILNSLTGEAVERGIACLAPYGRFVEIGKLDIYSNNPLPLGQFRQNLSYMAFDLDRLTLERPALVAEMLAELSAGLENGRFAALPHHRFAMAEVEEAFRLMAQGRHIGKIVLADEGARPALPSVGDIGCLLRDDGSYLIIGGLGGFGLKVAEHLASGNPGAIVLVGRNPPGTEAAARIARMRERVKVEVIAGDVGVASEVDRIFGEIDARLPPLRGIFHGAMVLDDKRVEELDAASLDRVMHPKARGAWNLHRASRDRPLDHFVLFSSIASLLGNPLQANYSGASAFLDALAHHRRAQGLPGIAINWGVLAEFGYVAERPELRRFLEQQGYRTFSSAQALDALEIVMRSDLPEVMAASIDWRRLADFSPHAASSPRLAGLVPSVADDSDNDEPSSAIWTALASASAEDRPALIETFLAAAIGRVLGLAADKVEPDRAFDELGLDSLLSVELMVVLTTELGFEMPVIALLDGMSVRKLGGLILAQLSFDRAPGPSRTRAAEPRAAVAPPVIEIDLAPPVQASAPADAIPALPRDPPADTSWSPLQRLARGVSRLGFGALGKVEIEGLDNLPPGPFILAVNHLSMADVPLALTVIPRRTIILANQRLQQSRLLHPIVGGLGEAIYVPKGRDIGPALERALKVLDKGGILALAPEGTRNRGGLGQGQTGVAWLARRSGLPVVPYVAWGQEAWRSRLRRLGRLPISVRIGAAIPPPDSDDDAGLLGYTDRVMTSLAALLPAAYRGVYADRPAS